MSDFRQGGAGSMEPEVRRRMLQAKLREHRAQTGLTQLEVARSLSWSQAKMNRIENGSVWVTPKDARMLTERYQVESADAEQLVQWAEEARRGSYGRNSLPLAKEFRLFLGLEKIATRMRYWQPTVVPGPLQTLEYARNVLEDAYPEAADDIGARLELRYERQIDLTESTPDFRAVLDEAVIRRRIGRGAAMRRQLQHLLALQELPHVTIRVLPLDAGPQGGLGGSFVLLSFDDQPDALYQERDSGSRLRQEDEAIEPYRTTFARMERHAASPGHSNDLIAEVAASM